MRPPDTLWLALAWLAGGLGLFLYGVDALSDGLHQLSGRRLRQGLARATRSAPVGLVLGGAVTALLQSSSAATVLVVGLIDAGLLTLRQSVAVILGTGMGSTVTVQLVTIPWLEYAALPALGAGALMRLMVARRGGRLLGQALFGFGAIFFGFALMKAAVAPWQDTVVRSWFAQLAGTSLSDRALALSVAAAATAIVQSSAATVGLVAVLASEGVIPGLGAALPLVLGCNVGTTITAVIAAFGRTPAARRSAAVHVIFRLAAALLALAMIPVYLRIVPATSDVVARQIANFDTLYSAFSGLVFLPLSGLLARAATWLVRGREDLSPAPQFIDFGTDPDLATALDRAGKETLRLADMARAMSADALRGLSERDERLLRTVLERERIMDNLHVATEQYLRAAAARHTGGHAPAAFATLLQALHHVERVGDHAENLVEIARVRAESVGVLPGVLSERILNLSRGLDELAGLALAAAKGGKPADAERVIATRQTFRAGLRAASALCRGEADAGHCPALAAAIFEDILANLDSSATHWKKAVTALHGLADENGGNHRGTDG